MYLVKYDVEATSTKVAIAEIASVVGVLVTFCIFRHISEANQLVILRTITIIYVTVAHTMASSTG